MSFSHGKNLKLIDRQCIYISDTVKLGNNVTVYENNRIEGETSIGDNCIILPNNHIINCKIKDNVNIESSHLNGAEIGSKSIIGPFARIRPSTKIGKSCKVGNFVEIKNSNLGDGTKVSHLTYIGDAEIGKDCNIGCGVIFVNYDGKNKNKTTVGDNCFIGSNVNIIAPRSIEHDSYICAGTTVSVDIKTNDFVIGRARPEIKPNRAREYLKK